jgi:Flp pilus assembly protein CpaB
VTFSQRIPAGSIAVSFSFDALREVDGLLVPGDQVDMIVPLSPTKPGVAPPGAVVPNGVETVFMQNVPILAIGAATAPQPGQTTAVTAGSGVITLALPPTVIERMLLIGSGNITLALVPPDNQPSVIPSVDPSNVFAGGLTPFG